MFTQFSRLLFYVTLISPLQSSIAWVKHFITPMKAWYKMQAKDDQALGLCYILQIALLPTSLFTILASVVSRSTGVQNWS